MDNHLARTEDILRRTSSATARLLLNVSSTGEFVLMSMRAVAYSLSEEECEGHSRKETYEHWMQAQMIALQKLQRPAYNLLKVKLMEEAKKRQDVKNFNKSGWQQRT
jgi:hypothetical protein